MANEIPEFLTNGIGQSLLILCILLMTVILERTIRKVLERSFKKSSKIIKVDPTQYNFLKHSITAIIYVIGIGFAVYLIPPLRALSVSVLAGAGVLAVIIGFASQQAFSNIISGVFIVMFKPFRVGDRIKVDDTVYGVVEDITLRHTVIRTFENKRVIIPNSIISNDVIENSDLNDEKICKFVEIGISYDSDINKAMKIMKEESMKHPNFIDNRTENEKKDGTPAVVVRVLGFGDYSINLRAWVWSKDPFAAFRMGCDLNKIIKERFDKEGIEIPFPYRTIVYKDKMEKK